MNWTHSSKLLVVGALLAIALGVAGIAAGASFDDVDVADEMEVGDQESVTVSTDEPFEEQSPGWTIEADTEFDDASVTIRAETPSETLQETSSGSAALTLDNEAISSVEVEVSGEVPEIEEYNYEDKEAENFDAVSISTGDGAFLEDRSVHRYTEESKEARQKIDEAATHVSSDDSDLQTAISLYNNGDFEQAVTEAEAIIDDAESEAQTQQLLLFGGAAVVLLAVLGGGYYAYSQRKKNTNKLQ